MPLEQTTKTSPESDEVIFFTDTNYNGDAYSSRIGDVISLYREDNPLTNKLHSVKVGSSCKLYAYEGGDFGNVSYIFESDAPTLGMEKGMSSFILLNRDEYTVLFTFSDQTEENHSMTLNSSTFDYVEKGDDGVTLPNPLKDPNSCPNGDRVFAVLKESNTKNNLIESAIYVRKENGEYEDIGALIYVYWDSGRIRVSEPDQYTYPNLTCTTRNYITKDLTLNFIWGLPTRGEVDRKIHIRKYTPVKN